MHCKHSKHSEIIIIQAQKLVETMGEAFEVTFRQEKQKKEVKLYNTVHVYNNTNDDDRRKDLKKSRDKTL